MELLYDCKDPPQAGLKPRTARSSGQHLTIELPRLLYFQKCPMTVNRNSLFQEGIQLALYNQLNIVISNSLQ